LVPGAGVRLAHGRVLALDTASSPPGVYHRHGFRGRYCAYDALDHARSPERNLYQYGASKGLLERAVVLKHALRNALVPVVTVVGIAFSLLLVGTVVVEDVFAIQGLGRTLGRSIPNRDFPVVQGAIILITGIFVGMNVLVDVLYAYINPKIRFE
jgi:ABC-type antimicrobial peptide transport system permease subunit